jgi:hypothetical protein
MVTLLRHTLLYIFVLFALQTAVAQGDASASDELTSLGIKLTKAFKKQDKSRLAECFFSKAEVADLLQIIAQQNGGEGEIQFDADSVYNVFITELDTSFEAALSAGVEEELKWKKIKFVEVGLSNLHSDSTLKAADLILVVKRKDNFFMITFPESYNLHGQWKIGPMVNWVGRVTK